MDKAIYTNYNILLRVDSFPICIVVNTHVCAYSLFVIIYAPPSRSLYDFEIKWS